MALAPPRPGTFVHRLGGRTPSDRALARGAGKGDARAFEAIFTRYEPALLAYCRHSLGHAQDAEDALQQTFISAHRALRANGPPEELRPWLYAIARNCCRDLHARRQPVAMVVDHPDLAGLGEAVQQREDLRALLGDLRALPEQQRSALLLSELEAMSHRQIGAVIGCPESKVRALVYQARRTLLAERAARDISCEAIREELAAASGPQLRQAHLRRHLQSCPGCQDFAGAVTDQRAALKLLLPVIPLGDLFAHIAAHTTAVAVTTAATTTGPVTAGTSGALASGLSGTSAGGLTSGVVTKAAVTVGILAAGIGAATALPGSSPHSPPRSAANAATPVSTQSVTPPGTVAAARVASPQATGTASTQTTATQPGSATSTGSAAQTSTFAATGVRSASAPVAAALHRRHAVGVAVLTTHHPAVVRRRTVARVRVRSRVAPRVTSTTPLLPTPATESATTATATRSSTLTIGSRTVTRATGIRIHRVRSGILSP